MLELAHPLLHRLEAGERVAVITVTRVLGSAPRALGSSMAVDASGAVIGSISGGCVEGQAYALAEEILDTRLPAADHFGFDDAEAFAAGLSCGGQITVFGRSLSADEPADAGVIEVLRAVARGEAGAVAFVVEGPPALRGLALTPETTVTDAVAAGLDEPAARRILSELAARLRTGESATIDVECGVPSSSSQSPELAVLVLASAPPPRLIIFGAVDFSAALCDAGALLGYDVTICDARGLFATEERFPSANGIVVEWPSDYLARTAVDERTVLAILTHDEKFDIPLLEVALGLDVAYVGAMGSRRTHDRRLELLTDAGVTPDALARLHSPIGLDIGASTPAETAVSIMAEVIQARTRASGAPLRATAGPIHATPSAAHPVG